MVTKSSNTETYFEKVSAAYVVECFILKTSEELTNVYQQHLVFFVCALSVFFLSENGESSQKSFVHV
jgi:hypothetical protein